MTQSLDLRDQDRVLEVGTGSAYQTAILCRLAKHVYTIERIPELTQSAYERMKSLDIENVSVHLGDGSIGWPEEAPFDKIITTAVAPSVPHSLISQLAENGRMVLPVASGNDYDKNQELLLISKCTGQIRIQKLGDCMFVRLIGKEGF
jgi:protein-L-isoaspartate(D-aspartate) O-methyltransferase